MRVVDGFEGNEVVVGKVVNPECLRGVEISLWMFNWCPIKTEKKQVCCLAEITFVRVQMVL